MTPRRTGGFTLVEMIVSIVILGILAGIVAVFIRAPILGYRDSVDRAEITDQADLALRRMARDIRLAAPNSVRVTAGHDAVEFLQTRTGGRYLSVDDDPAGAFPDRVLSFDQPNQRVFAAFMSLASRRQVRANDYVVVNNLGPDFDPANAYKVPAAGQAGNIAQIAGVADSSTTGLANAVDITLRSNPFAAQQPALPSASYRFQVVSGAVTFYCKDEGNGLFNLYRLWNYGIQASQQAEPAGAARALVASRLTGCNLFTYSVAANQRTGLVGIDLSLHGRNDNDPAVRLVHQVHVDNTP